MGKKIDIFKQAAGDTSNKKNPAITTAKSEMKVSEENIQVKKKTKILAIEVLLEDLSKFDLAMIKLSNRDNTLYKRKDVYIAMTKYFFDTIEKNIDKIKIEKN